MIIQRNGFDNWTSSVSGSATATITDTYFEFGSNSSTTSILTRQVLVGSGQTLAFKCMASTSWQRPRIQFEDAITSALLNYVDLDLIVGTQACELQWTNPLNSSPVYVKITIGSVSGLNAAGIISEAEIHILSQPARRVVAEGVIKIENGVATIDKTYETANVASVNADTATISIDLKTPLVQSGSGFVKPTISASRLSGGPLAPPLLELMPSYAANKITMTALTLTQNATTKDVSFGYFNWTSVTTAIRINFIVYQ